MQKNIKKILIANRGEIACRIIRTCEKMGIRSVAVYSDVDRTSPHVILADEAYSIGKPMAYLDMDRIIQTALDAKADAIHPGYGFLSENADFASKVAKAGIRFIGPEERAIRLMGNKLDAKATVKPYDIPLVPGTEQAIRSADEATKYAQKIGLPVLIKAAAGGGGKGMRKIDDIKTIASDIERAMSEAQNAFGDPAVFVEKYIENPRHIEIQILADQHGNTIHLFERECSIQRRHQKVIEEAPSALLDQELRTKMGAAAVRVAQSCNYVGAGTVEFLVDAYRNFYFLEMNTRLQVEHPVTEFITGLDLVEQQIRIAQNEKLSIKQDDLHINGHSIELRVYAEDPNNGFVPSIGTLVQYQPPKAPSVRVDGGYRKGMEIPLHYDPLISKLIVHGTTRSDAINKMARAISQYQINGVKTTLDFGNFVMHHPAFVSGQFDTGFVDTHFYNTERGQNAQARIKNHSLIAVALYEKLKAMKA